MAPRRTAWQDRLVNASITSGGNLENDVMSDLSKDENRGSTIVRVIGDLTMYSATTAGAWGAQNLDIGLGILERDAMIAGIVPDPNNSTDSPARGWLFRTRCTVFQNGVGTPIGIKCMFDIRAQRRVNAGTLAVMYTNTNAIGASFTVLVSGIFRVLYKLS